MGRASKATGSKSTQAGMRRRALDSSLCPISFPEAAILLVSGRGSRPLARSNSGSPRFTDFPLLCACSESSLTNLIGSGLNLLCLQSHSKPECRWTWPEVVIFGADQKERGLWGREFVSSRTPFRPFSHRIENASTLRLFCPGNRSNRLYFQLCYRNVYKVLIFRDCNVEYYAEMRKFK